MIATLTFNLPEESAEHESAIRGADYRQVIWDMNQWLRDQVKHQGRAELAEARAHLAVLMADAGLDE